MDWTSWLRVCFKSNSEANTNLTFVYCRARQANNDKYHTTQPRLMKLKKKTTNLEFLFFDSERGSCSRGDASFHASEYSRLAGKLPGDMTRAAKAEGGVRLIVFSIAPVIARPTGVQGSPCKHLVLGTESTNSNRWTGCQCSEASYQISEQRVQGKGFTQQMNYYYSKLVHCKWNSEQKLETLTTSHSRKNS